MTVKDLTEKLEGKLFTGNENNEVTGVYTGDLLSWVMSHASSGDAWITVINNMNILAVATLTDVACVVVAEGCDVEESVLKKAEEEDITIIGTPLDSAEAVIRTAALLRE